MTLWIESHADLRDHPKLIHSASILNVDKVKLIGHLHCLWWWALTYAPNGELGGLDAQQIAAAAGWDGDPAAFLAALVHSGRRGQKGLIESDKRGLRIHDWHSFAGKLLDQRERARKRQTDLRTKAKIRRTSHVPTPDTPSTSRVTVPYRTVPILKSSSEIVVVDPHARITHIREKLDDDDRERLNSLSEELHQDPDDVEGITLLATIVDDYPRADLILEARKCKTTKKTSQNWPVTFANWLGGAKHIQLDNSHMGTQEQARTPRRDDKPPPQQPAETRPPAPPTPSSGVPLWDTLVADLHTTAEGTQAYDTYLRTAKVRQPNAATLLIEAPNPQAKEWMDARLRPAIAEFLATRQLPPVTLKCSVQKSPWRSK